MLDAIARAMLILDRARKTAHFSKGLNSVARVSTEWHTSKTGLNNVSLMETFPKRRCTVYESLELSRKEGSAICKEMGWGLSKPLLPEQVRTLEYLAKRLHEWRSRNLSLQSFCDFYLDKLRKDGRQITD